MTVKYNSKKLPFYELFFTQIYTIFFVGFLRILSLLLSVIILVRINFNNIFFVHCVFMLFDQRCKFIKIISILVIT